jgi:S-adenosylmethionine-diacylglycerol 3-amino-3-carboxypropyl transferase
MNKNCVFAENIEKSSFFKKVAYSTCWEDFEIIKKALRIKKGENIITITSAGCNTLNFLLKNPDKIISVDFNPNQNYILELKIKAIKYLNYNEFLELLGIVDSKIRIDHYKKIRDHLSKKSQFFWNNKLKFIKIGITYNGRQERYIHSIGQYLRYLKGEKILINFLKTKNMKEQKNYFKKYIKDFSWDLYFNIIYNKPVMMLAKDKLVFNQIKDKDFHKKFRRRVEDAATRIPARNNPFMSFALLGYYLNQNYYPDYLKKKNFDLLKKRIDHIEIKTGPIQDILSGLPSNYIDKFNLSNVLDWTTKNQFKDIILDLKRVGKEGSRFCYLNTLMKRHIPKIEGIKSYKKEANKLLKQDKAFLYENFEIGEIKK